MGLDNGFCINHIDRKEIPSFVKLPFENTVNHDGSIDICYYRKCWGIRNDILSILHVTENNDSHTNVDAEDIPAIIKALEKYCSKEYWDANADSIWEFEEVFEFTLIQQIINLKWLYSYMLEHSEVTCYFYDSW